uniref:Uncharacterized protein n=1 Tax=Anopheles atroparvus TaxID=41427 RepID=A0AAG5CXY5_ANOAO
IQQTCFIRDFLNRGFLVGYLQSPPAHRTDLPLVDAASSLYRGGFQCRILADSCWSRSSYRFRRRASRSLGTHKLHYDFWIVSERDTAEPLRPPAKSERAKNA